MAQCLHLRPEIVADIANHNRLTNIKQQQQQQTKQKNKQTNQTKKQQQTCYGPSGAGRRKV
jgi:hypothetical protein